MDNIMALKRISRKRIKRNQRSENNAMKAEIMAAKYHVINEISAINEMANQCRNQCGSAAAYRRS
jgi:hypothetical protein